MSTRRQTWALTGESKLHRNRTQAEVAKSGHEEFRWQTGRTRQRAAPRHNRNGCASSDRNRRFPTRKPAAIRRTFRKPARSCARKRRADYLVAAQPHRSPVRVLHQPSPDPPHQRMKPEDRLDNHVQRCSSVNKSARPSGSTNTGRKIPNTPGSSTAVFVSRQLRNQRTNRQSDPASQIAVSHWNSAG
jgi:hypothetical protein